MKTLIVFAAVVVLPLRAARSPKILC